MGCFCVSLQDLPGRSTNASPADKLPSITQVNASMPIIERLGLALSITLIVFGSLLVYLQTPYGFRHVILPLAEQFTGATFEARNGMVTFTGSLRIEGLQYEDPAAGVTIDAERLNLRAAWWSFITDRVLRIHDFELQEAQIRVEIKPAEAGTREAEN